jgi:hypothetical protein
MSTPTACQREILQGSRVKAKICLQKLQTQSAIDVNQTKTK